MSHHGETAQDKQRKLDNMGSGRADVSGAIADRLTKDPEVNQIAKTYKQLQSMGKSNLYKNAGYEDIDAEKKLFAVEGGVDRTAWTKGLNRENTILYKKEDRNINFYEGSGEHAAHLLKNWDQVNMEFPSLKDPQIKEKMRQIVQKIAELREFTNEEFAKMITSNNFSDEEIYGEEGVLQLLLAYRRALAANLDFDKMKDSVKTVILKISNKPGKQRSSRYTKVSVIASSSAKPEVRRAYLSIKPDNEDNQGQIKEKPKPEVKRASVSIKPPSENKQGQPKEKPKPEVKKASVSIKPPSENKQGQPKEKPKPEVKRASVSLEPPKETKLTLKDGSTFDGTLHKNGQPAYGTLKTVDRKLEGEFYSWRFLKQGNIYYKNGMQEIGSFYENGALKDGERIHKNGARDIYRDGKVVSSPLAETEAVKTEAAKTDAAENNIAEIDTVKTSKENVKQKLMRVGKQAGFKELGFWADAKNYINETVERYEIITNGVRQASEKLMEMGIDKRMLALVRIKLIGTWDEGEGWNSNFKDVLTIDPEESADQISEDILKGMKDFLEDESEKIEDQYEGIKFIHPPELTTPGVSRQVPSLSSSDGKGGMWFWFIDKQTGRSFDIRINRFQVTITNSNSPWDVKLENGKVIIYKKTSA